MSVFLIDRIKREGFISEIKRLRVKYYFFLRKFSKKEFISKSGCLKSFYGPHLKENWDDITFRFCLRGSYGNFYSSFLENFTDKFTFIDIGANQGIYSLVAARNQNCVLVNAFEPVPNTYSFLRENFCINNLLYKANLYKKAIDSSTGHIKILFDASHSGSASIAKYKDNSSELNIETINSEALKKIPIAKNSKIIIKVDVEGHEKIVLDELHKTSFFKDIFAIYIEYDENIPSSKKIIRFMRENNFTCTPIKDKSTKSQYNIHCLRDN